MERSKCRAPCERAALLHSVNDVLRGLIELLRKQRIVRRYLVVYARLEQLELVTD